MRSSNLKTIIFSVPVFLSLFFVTTTAGKAFGEDSISVSADGVADGTDSKARQAAIDAAFAVAIRRTLVGMLERNTVRENSIKLDRDVVRHARRFITSYKVERESRDSQKTQVSIMAEVDRDRVRETLAEVGLLGTTNTRAGRPKIAVLLKSSQPDKTAITFGTNAEHNGYLARTIKAELAAQGFDVVWTTDRPQLSSESGQLVGSAAASEMARNAGAGAVIVAGLSVSDDGVIRGTGRSGAAGYSIFEVTEVSQDSVLASAKIEDAGFGKTVGEAYQRTSETLLVSTLRKAAEALHKRWPTQSSGGAEAQVRFVGTTKMADVSRVMAEISQIRGVRRVSLIWDGGGVVLRVISGLSNADLAAKVAGTRIPQGQVQSRQTTAGVDISVSSSSFDSEI